MDDLKLNCSDGYSQHDDYTTSDTCSVNITMKKILLFLNLFVAYATFAVFFVRNTKQLLNLLYKRSSKSCDNKKQQSSEIQKVSFFFMTFFYVINFTVQCYGVLFVDKQWSIKKNAPLLVLFVISPYSFCSSRILLEERKKNVKLFLSVPDLRESSKISILYLKFSLYIGYTCQLSNTIILSYLIFIYRSFDKVGLVFYASSGISNFMESLSGILLLVKLDPVVNKFVSYNEILIKENSGPIMKLTNENENILKFLKFLKGDLFATTFVFILMSVYIGIGMPRQYILNNYLNLAVGISYLHRQIDAQNINTCHKKVIPKS